MSIVAIALRHMFAAGMSNEAIMACVEEMEAEIVQRTVQQDNQREKWRESKRKYRASKDCPSDKRKEPKENNNIYINPLGKGAGKTLCPSDTNASFDKFWEVYPRKVGKGPALKAWKAKVGHGSDPETIIAGARRYALEMRGVEPKYIKHAQGWLNGERWLDEPDNKPKSNVIAGSFRKEFKPDAPSPEFTPEEKARRLALVDQLKQSLKAMPKR